MLQIKGEDFLKKVQLQQEKEELERKLTELDESRVSINSINSNNNFNNAYDTNMDRNSTNNQFENEPSEFDNIMLENPTIPNNDREDNKKKYLILGILLVVLFLLTIIIIRLLTSNSQSEDQFTSSNSSPEMKTLTENSNAIDANYQKIVDTQKERNEANAQQTATQTASQQTTEQKPENTTELNQNLLPLNESSTNQTAQTSTNVPTNSISNTTMDEAIKKVEEKKATTTKTEPKKSIKDLVEKSGAQNAQNFAAVENGYFVQIGAFSKEPTRSYLSKVEKEGFKYKVIQEEVKGTIYNKVLIGPYSSDAAAKSSVATIKERLNLKSVFTVKR